MLLNATTGPIEFKDAKEGGDIVATGVEFIHEGKSYAVHARKEVILSAGYVRSHAYAVVIQAYIRSLVARSTRPKSWSYPVLVNGQFWRRLAYLSRSTCQASERMSRTISLVVCGFISII